MPKKGAGTRDGRILRMATSAGIRKGVVGGSRFWFLVAAGTTAFRVLRRITGSGPEIVYSEELAPGQSLVISNGADPR